MGENFDKWAYGKFDKKNFDKFHKINAHIY